MPIKGFPDFTVWDNQDTRHIILDVVILEIKMKGTHLGEWAGLKPTRHKMDVPVACIFDFEKLIEMWGRFILTWLR